MTMMTVCNEFGNNVHSIDVPVVSLTKHYSVTMVQNRDVSEFWDNPRVELRGSGIREGVRMCATGECCSTTHKYCVKMSDINNYLPPLIAH